MGTRADFYIGRGLQAQWLGSIAWDGYPGGIDDALLKSESEREYTQLIILLLNQRDDRTLPEMGWPWPWEDSRTTDYAYAFDGGKVWASSFGHEWFDPLKPEDEVADKGPKKVVFPNMKDKMRITFGERSGLTFVRKID